MKPWHEHMVGYETLVQTHMVGYETLGVNAKKWPRHGRASIVVKLRVHGCTEVSGREHMVGYETLTLTLT